jgi:hypothetical protein
MEQMIVNNRIKSTYDIKSVHAQKYRLSKSAKKKTMTQEVTLNNI